jgi:hypothetical protein
MTACSLRMKMQNSDDLFKLKEPPDLVILREHSEPKDL